MAVFGEKRPLYTSRGGHSTQQEEAAEHYEKRVCNANGGFCHSTGTAPVGTHGIDSWEEWVVSFARVFLPS